MRLALAPKATGAEQDEVDVDEVEEAEVLGGARGKRRLDMIGSMTSHSRLTSGIESVMGCLGCRGPRKAAELIIRALVSQQNFRQR
jgi:hypothetical protein